MECNYKSAKWYGEKHLEPDNFYIYIYICVCVILALKKLGCYTPSRCLAPYPFKLLYYIHLNYMCVCYVSKRETRKWCKRFITK
jgi:hypothetical protein